MSFPALWFPLSSKLLSFNLSLLAFLPNSFSPRLLSLSFFRLFGCLILFLLPYAFMGIPVNRNSTRYNATHTKPVSSLMHLWSSDAGNQTGAHWLSSAMRGLILHYSRYWMNAWSCVKKSSGQCAAAGTQKPSEKQRYVLIQSGIVDTCTHT